MIPLAPILGRVGGLVVLLEALAVRRQNSPIGHHWVGNELLAFGSIALSS